MGISLAAPAEPGGPCWRSEDRWGRSPGDARCHPPPHSSAGTCRHRRTPEREGRKEGGGRGVEPRRGEQSTEEGECVEGGMEGGRKQGGRKEDNRVEMREARKADFKPYAIFS